MLLSFHNWTDSAIARGRVAALGGNEIQVWIAKTPADEGELTVLANLLSPAEQFRAQQFRVAEPRRQFVFGRALLRQLLGACKGIAPAALEFSHSLRGKPFLAQPAGDLRFSLSRSGGLVAIALTRGREVGVDLESMHRLIDWPSVAAHVFSAHELRELRSLPEPAQKEAFFKGWTCKEAYLKATGEGLTDALPAIELTLAPGKEPELRTLPDDPNAVRQWMIRTLPLPPGFTGAVAFKNLPPPLDFP